MDNLLTPRMLGFSQQLTFGAKCGCGEMSGEAIEIVMEGCSRLAEAAEVAGAGAVVGSGSGARSSGGGGSFGLAALASFRSSPEEGYTTGKQSTAAAASALRDVTLEVLPGMLQEMTPKILLAAGALKRRKTNPDRKAPSEDATDNRT